MKLQDLDLSNFAKIRDDVYFGVMTFRDYASFIKDKVKCTDKTIVNNAELNAVIYNKKDNDEIIGYTVNLFVTENEIIVFDNFTTLTILNLEDRFMDNKLCIRVYTGSLENARKMFMQYRSQER